MAATRTKLPLVLLASFSFGGSIPDGCHRVPGACLRGDPFAPVPCTLVAVPEVGIP